MSEMTVGNRVTPMIDAPMLFEDICCEIESGRHSFFAIALSFVHERDFKIRGMTFLQWLIWAQEQTQNGGLQVRLLAWRPASSASTGKCNPVFINTLSDKGVARLRAHGVIVKLDTSPNMLHCHHEKSFFFDTVAYTGGIIPGLKWMTHHRHDVSIKVEGPVVKDALMSFNQRWGSAICEIKHQNDSAGDAQCQWQRSIMPRIYTEIPNGDDSILRFMIEAIDGAKRAIYIEQQHFAYAPLLSCLERALERGVHVTYLAPGFPKNLLVRLILSLPFARYVLRPIDRIRRWLTSSPNCAYEQVFLYQLPRLNKFPNFTLLALEGIYVHSKLICVDDEVCAVGSANLVAMSYDKDHTEAQLAVWDENTCRKLRMDLMEEHLGVKVDPDCVEAAIQCSAPSPKGSNLFIMSVGTYAAVLFTVAMAYSIRFAGY